MNPLVSLELARLDVEERRKEADAWRASHPGPRRSLRVRLGATLQHVGARLEGCTEAASSPAPRRPVVRLP